jgi:MFS family permease
VYLFVFLGAVAAGTLAGGPVGDRIGFRAVIWVSILGVLPFTLVLPYMNLFWKVTLTVPIGLVLASAFSAIIVYAQELLPSRVGTVAGLVFGFAFGMGALARPSWAYLPTVRALISCIRSARSSPWLAYEPASCRTWSDKPRPRRQYEADARCQASTVVTPPGRETSEI